MKIPKRIQPLIEEGLVDEVISQLMSGKEATVYVVRCGTEIRCAKVYKEASKRSFKKAVEYQEGRKGRNSRRARAMEKGTRFGRYQRGEGQQRKDREQGASRPFARMSDHGDLSFFLLTTRHPPPTPVAANGSEDRPVFRSRSPESRGRS